MRKCVCVCVCLLCRAVWHICSAVTWTAQLSLLFLWPHHRLFGWSVKLTIKETGSQMFNSVYICFLLYCILCVLWTSWPIFVSPCFKSIKQLMFLQSFDQGANLPKINCHFISMQARVDSCCGLQNPAVTCRPTKITKFQHFEGRKCYEKTWVHWLPW